MNDQKLVRMAVNAPIHAPFKERKGLFSWQRLERDEAVDIEYRLRAKQAPNAGR